MTNMHPINSWVDGAYGKALEFDGVDDNFTIPNLGDEYRTIHILVTIRLFRLFRESDPMAQITHLEEGMMKQFGLMTLIPQLLGKLWEFAGMTEN